MTRILVTGFEPKLENELKLKLLELENEVKITPFEDVKEQFMDYIPDIVLMNFADMDRAAEKTRELIEFDSTACIFAVADKVSEMQNDEMYNAGVRVVLDNPINDIEKFLENPTDEVDKLLDNLYLACNDLDHENCIGCWKFNRYDNLQKLA